MRYMAAIAGVVLMAGTGASAFAEGLSVRLPGVAVTRIHASFECGADGVDGHPKAECHLVKKQ